MKKKTYQKKKVDQNNLIIENKDLKNNIKNNILKINNDEIEYDYEETEDWYEYNDPYFQKIS